MVKEIAQDGSNTGRAQNGKVTKARKISKNREKFALEHRIPIFLQKTYEMISECDSNLAEWTTDGEMFVVKNVPQFASSVIPAYFDHNKFSSFTRSLNFYGFQKVRFQPVRLVDIDKSRAGYVIYSHKNFKRGRKDLLVNIERYKRGKGSADVYLERYQQKTIDSLKDMTMSYERQIAQLTARMDLMDKSISAMVAQLNPNRPERAPQSPSTSLEQQPTSPLSPIPNWVVIDGGTVPTPLRTTVSQQPTLNPHRPSAVPSVVSVPNSPRALSSLPAFEPRSTPGAASPSVSRETSSMSLGEPLRILHDEQAPYEYASGDHHADGTASDPSRRPPQHELDPELLRTLLEW